jgi:peptide/nickel transport system substrate-binding protein
VPQQQVELARNERYWGERPQWDRVVFRAMSSPATRLAALQAGDLDLIDRVPTADIARLRSDQRFALATSRSPLLVTFFPDHFARVPPYVRDNEGRPLAENPLRDLRVRRAISLAINRDALVERVMEGEASATGQFMPEGFSGYLPDVRPDPYDPERAHALLAEAGFPEGFQLTIHCMNDRLVNDARICQAVGQMLTRAGIRTAVETMPNAVQIPRAQRNEFSLWLHGMATETAEPTAMLIPSVATTDAARGRGAINRGRYTNPAFDRLLDQALATLDDRAREAIMAQAQHLLLDDLAVIPLYFQVNTWGMRAAIAYQARADESTLAMDARPR